MSSKGSYLESFPGRSWLFPDGTCQVLSTGYKIQEVGVTHKDVVFARCRALVAAAFGIPSDQSHWPEVLKITSGKLTNEQLQATGLHRDVVQIAFQLGSHDAELGDIRLWALEHWGWTRQGGSILETWGLSAVKLRMIALALKKMSEQLKDRGFLERQCFELRDLSTRSHHQRVPFHMLESGGAIGPLGLADQP